MSIKKSSRLLSRHQLANSSSILKPGCYAHSGPPTSELTFRRKRHPMSSKPMPHRIVVAASGVGDAACPPVEKLSMATGSGLEGKKAMEVMGVVETNPIKACPVRPAMVLTV